MRFSIKLCLPWGLQEHCITLPCYSIWLFTSSCGNWLFHLIIGFEPITFWLEFKHSTIELYYYIIDLSECSSSCFIVFWTTKYNTQTYRFSNWDFLRYFSVSLPLVLESALTYYRSDYIPTLPFLISRSFAWNMIGLRPISPMSELPNWLLFPTFQLPSWQDHNVKKVSLRILL